ncbi:MAG: glycogen synthase [Clostridia bacterium]|nr:glycogen synthase [Clostridia bacterium]
MKVLFVASEVAPFVASGGLGDVMGALPQAVVSSAPSVKCEVILPLYSSVGKEYKERMKKVLDISFDLSWRKTGASVYSLFLNGVTYYFVENHYYFDRDRLYGEWDDGERFAFFSRAVLEFLRRTKNIPDVLHANDWQAALTVIYLKTEYQDIQVLSDIRTVFTIHNIEYQGKFDPRILGDVFAIDHKYYQILAWDGCINLLKGALETADFISTVSPTYSKELCDDYFSFGLSPMIKKISGKFKGILNGIDYDAFSPEKGKEIYLSYGAADRKEGKAYNKRELQKELGLPMREDAPMISMITRLTAGKGVDLLLRVIDEIMQMDVQFILLGTGDASYEQAFREIGAHYPTFKCLLRFDRALSKKIYAASDIFLMPSKSEPCGLAQMIACSYGTLPLVRAVGGLKDSIIHNENGFVFEDFNAHRMLNALTEALHLYRAQTDFEKMCDRAKSSDFSWKKSAGTYIEMYESLIKR